MAENLQVETLPGGPAPFVATTALPPALTDADVRAMTIEAEKSGSGVVVPTQTPAPAVPAQPVMDVPAKFFKPDGTVDVEKLQTSSKQLDEAIQQKQLTIDEMVAQYREKERQFRNLPRKPEQVAQAAQQIVAQPPAPVQAPMPVPIPDPNAAYQRLLSEYQKDPIGTMVELAQEIAQRQVAPFMQFVENNREQQRTDFIKSSLIELAKIDPMVANPLVYNEIIKELESDPGYLNLKNPHKAAWNEVKARLRLGDSPKPAQPSITTAPILGGGTPPPVPSSSAGPTPQNLAAAISQAKSKEEMKNLEDVMRGIANQVEW